ncbi:hypothetical protein [Glaciecola sp. 1036]|uniref:hypothetical protein n=1 Tax=Alteromonadaceae TaxID=72275 RepID=UPI003D00EE7B
MKTGKFNNTLALVSGSIVFILYLFTFVMLTESRWRFLGNYSETVFTFIIPMVYLLIGIVLVFWLISFCVSIVRLIGESSPLQDQSEVNKTLQNNLIRHLRVIGISLMFIFALEILNDEVEEEISFVMLLTLATLIPILIGIFDTVLPSVNNIFLPRWTFAGWFSVIGFGVLLAIPFSDIQQATQFASTFFTETWKLVSGSEEALKAEYVLVSVIYLFLTFYYLYKIIVQWKKIRGDIYTLYRKLRYLGSKHIRKQQDSSES